MAISKISAEDLLSSKIHLPLLDVRSPSEFSHAHIPGATSLPLFSDDERRIIGTAYKQESREKAIKLGMEAFGRKMVQLVEQAEQVIKEKSPGNTEVVLHCWRGGMRSAAVAWLLDLYGFKVYLLSGGYKAYRHLVLQQLEKDYNLMILGGYTGSNKTGALLELRNCGEMIIDLEGLAVHKGSAFGNLEQAWQPGQEHFENLLAQELFKCSESKKRIWVEGESQRLGYVNIPLPFFKTMRISPMIFLDVPFDARLKHIVEGYGKYEKEKLVNGILRIKKRLGGLETKNAVSYLIEDNVTECFRILLRYYDKLYIKSTYATTEAGSRTIIHIKVADTNAKANVKKLLSHD